MQRKKKKNNDSKICPICKRCFANGKAVGGHMRSHLAKLPIPPKPAPITPPIDHIPLEISKVDVDSGSSTHKRLISFSSAKCHLMKKLPVEQNFHPMDQDLAARVLNPIDEQGSESDQSYMTRKRSKHFHKIDDATIKVMLPPKTKVDEHNPKQTGSFFDSFFPIINAALTLISLSKEKWAEGEELINKKQKVNEQEYSYVEVESHGRRFQCEMCKKVFGSPQALGKHKASHKMFTKNDRLEVDGEFNEENWNGDVVKDPKVFKCPHCSKVLGSSQGLGRHKKIHFPNAMKFGQ